MRKCLGTIPDVRQAHDIEDCLRYRSINDRETRLDAERVSQLVQTET